MFCNFERVVCPTLPDILGTIEVLEKSYKNSIKERSCTSCHFNDPQNVTVMKDYVTTHSYCQFYNEFKSEINCSQWRLKDSDKHYKPLYDYIVNMGKARYGTNNSRT